VTSGLIGGMDTQLRVQEVAVRCGGGVYGAAPCHASPAPAVGWCHGGAVHGGDGVSSKNPQPHRPPFLTPPTSSVLPFPSRTQTLSLSSPLSSSLSRPICICFSPPCLSLSCPWRAQRFDFFFLGEEPESEQEWRREGGDPDLLSQRGGEDRRRKMAAQEQEQEQEKQQAKTSTTSSLPSSSERSSSSARNNLTEGGRCRAQPVT
jgi:hypothetical protein